MRIGDYFEKIESLPIEFKIFNLSVLFSAIIGVYEAIRVFVMKQSAIFLILCLISTVILFCAYYLGVNKKIGMRVRNMFIAYIVFVFFPITYILNGGIEGTGLIYIGFFVVIAAICADKTTRELYIILLFMAILVLIIFEYRFTYVLYEYKTEYLKLIDISISVFIVITFISIIISNFISEFYRLKNYSTIYYRELSKRNKELEEDNEQVEKLYSYVKGKNDVLQTISMKDQLTGIYNRRYIFNRLKKEMYYSIKMKFKLSILMIDIDDFKLINDNYGHQEGDKLLKEVAAAITKGLEHRGIAGRYGGDEFLIILPRCNLDKAERIGFEIADRIKLTEVSGKAYNIKFSAGAAEYYGEDINAFIKRVDKLLYVSKKTGKNRINK